MAGSRRRILVIEDDPETGEQLVESLATSGYEVDLAVSGECGLERRNWRRPAGRIVGRRRAARGSFVAGTRPPSRVRTPRACGAGTWRAPRTAGPLVGSPHRRSSGAPSPTAAVTPRRTPRPRRREPRPCARACCRSPGNCSSRRPRCEWTRSGRVIIILSFQPMLMIRSGPEYRRQAE